MDDRLPAVPIDGLSAGERAALLACQRLDGHCAELLARALFAERGWPWVEKGMPPSFVSEGEGE